MEAAALWSSMMRWPGHREGELQMEIGVAECGGAGVLFILLERRWKGEEVVADVGEDLLQPFHRFWVQEAIGRRHEEGKRRGIGRLIFTAQDST
jgi:hypothetical protein